MIRKISAKSVEKENGICLQQEKKKKKNSETKSIPVIEHIGRELEGRNLILYRHDIPKKYKKEL